MCLSDWLCKIKILLTGNTSPLNTPSIHIHFLPPKIPPQNPKPLPRLGSKYAPRKLVEELAVDFHRFLASSAKTSSGYSFKIFSSKGFCSVHSLLSFQPYLLNSSLSHFIKSEQVEFFFYSHYRVSMFCSLAIFNSSALNSTCLIVPFSLSSRISFPSSELSGLFKMFSNPEMQSSL